MSYAIFATSPQEESCDIRFCDIRIAARKGSMTRDEINAILDQRGVKNVDLADLLGISADKVSKSRSSSGTRQWRAEEFAKIKRHLQIDVEPAVALPTAGTSYAAPISVEMLARLLHALGPAIPNGEISESAARSLAVALTRALELLSSTGATDPTDREIAMAVRAATSQFPEGVQP